MVVPDLLFSLFVAVVISIVFARILHRQGPRKGFFWFFLTIFLTVLAVGIWAKPYGADLSENNWLPFLLAGLFMAILLTMLAPRFPKIHNGTQLDRNQTMDMLDSIEQEKEFSALAYISMNVFFWIFLLLLIAAIVSRYVI